MDMTTCTFPPSFFVITLYLVKDKWPYGIAVVVNYAPFASISRLRDKTYAISHRPKPSVMSGEQLSPCEINGSTPLVIFNNCKSILKVSGVIKSRRDDKFPINIYVPALLAHSDCTHAIREFTDI